MMFNPTDKIIKEFYGTMCTWSEDNGEVIDKVAVPKAAYNTLKLPLNRDRAGSFKRSKTLVNDKVTITKRNSTETSATNSIGEFSSVKITSDSFLTKTYLILLCAAC